MDEQAVAQETATVEGQETLTFQSERFGSVTVGADRLLEFPRGLVGFPDQRRFVFIHREDGHGPFFWLHSIEDPTLAFVVCESHVFFPQYTVPLTREDQEVLGIQEAAEGVVCLILVVPGDPMDITANLRGPVVVNVETRVGMQVVLAGDDLPTKARVFTPDEKGGDACSS